MTVATNFVLTSQWIFCWRLTRSIPVGYVYWNCTLCCYFSSHKKLSHVNWFMFSLPLLLLNEASIIRLISSRIWFFLFCRGFLASRHLNDETYHIFVFLLVSINWIEETSELFGAKKTNLSNKRLFGRVPKTKTTKFQDLWNQYKASWKLARPSFRVLPRISSGWLPGVWTSE